MKKLIGPVDGVLAHAANRAAVAQAPRMSVTDFLELLLRMRVSPRWVLEAALLHRRAARGPINPRVFVP